MMRSRCGIGGRRASGRRRFAAAAAAGLLAAVVAAPPARGLINPTFTPVQMAAESSLILSLEVGPVGEPTDRLPAKVVKALKGTPPAAALTIDLSQAGQSRVDELKQALGEGGRAGPALLFSGAYKGLGDDDANAATPGKATGALHVGCLWFPVVQGENGTWQITPAETQLQAVWNGGTDGLRRATEYALADPNANIPADSGILWGTRSKLGSVPGKVAEAVAVDTENDGRVALFVASDGGDRLFRCEPGAQAFADVTARVKLGSASRAAAWGAFAGRGKPALASWDGKALSLWAAGDDGSYTHRAVDVQLTDGCVGLGAIEVRGRDRAAILVSGPGGLTLLSPAEGDRWEATPLPAAAGQAELGAGGRAVVADVDGDGTADVVQPFVNGSVFRKGGLTRLGEPTVWKQVSGGEGRSVMVAADFEGEGRLDLLTAGEGGVGRWGAAGNGSTLEDTFAESGELVYKSKREATAASPCDLNTDGRQDLVLFYRDALPQPYFSRGFGTFGFAAGLGFTDESEIPDLDHGQQAGVVADFAGTGAPALAMVLTSGDVWAVFRSPKAPADGTGVASRLGVSLFAGPSGPLGQRTVVGYEGSRCLGARTVAPGQPAFFGKLNKGPLRLEWLPPGDATKRSVSVVVVGATRHAIGDTESK